MEDGELVMGDELKLPLVWLTLCADFEKSELDRSTLGDVGNSELDCESAVSEEEVELELEDELECSAVWGSLCADFEKSDVDCSL